MTTPIEVAQIMAEILDIDEIGTDQNFFEVGGNSFLVLILITRIWERSGASLAMIDILRAPTPAGVSELIDHVAVNTGTPR